MTLTFVKESVRKGITWALAVLVLAYTILLGCNLCPVSGELATEL